MRNIESNYDHKMQKSINFYLQIASKHFYRHRVISDHKLYESLQELKDGVYISK